MNRQLNVSWFWFSGYMFPVLFCKIHPCRFHFLPLSFQTLFLCTPVFDLPIMSGVFKSVFLPSSVVIVHVLHSCVCFWSLCVPCVPRCPDLSPHGFVVLHCAWARNSFFCSSDTATSYFFKEKALLKKIKNSPLAHQLSTKYQMERVSS